MLFSEWVCLGCHRTFTERLSIDDCREGRVECPQCGSADVEQVFDDDEAIVASTES